MSLRTCPECGDSFVSRHGNRKYCTKRCASTRYVQYPEATYGESISRGNAGAVSELLACADLLRKGFHVFRSVSPSCPCDIVVITPTGVLLRIEVKTARINKRTGAIYTQKAPVENYDVLCHVFPDSITYDPPINEWP